MVSSIFFDHTCWELHCNIFRARQYDSEDARRAVEASLVGKAVAAMYGLKAPYEWRGAYVKAVMLILLPAMNSFIHGKYGYA